MPANLPPQYFEAEKRFRMAKTAPEKIAALEEMMAIMPKHKGTDHLRGELRRRIAKLTQSSDKKSATRRASMVVQREGAAQLAVIGPPNTGKSQLICKVTNASPAVAEYAFTTYTVTPGMMEFENIQIQLIDTPPLVTQSMESWFPTTLIRADALLVVIDLAADALAQMENVIAELRNIKIGILDEEEEEPDEITEIIRHKKALIVGNKIDQPGASQQFSSLQNRYGDRLTVASISARDGTGIEELKVKIFQMLDIIRIYTKSPGNKPDLNDPIILRRGSTLDDAAAEVHKDIRDKLKFARVWGSGKHDGIMVKRNHVLEDGDIIELHT